MAMVVLGLVVSSMMGVLGTVSQQATFSEDTARASFLAQSKLEQARLASFNANYQAQNGDILPSAGTGPAYRYYLYSGNSVCNASALCAGVSNDVCWPQYANVNSPQDYQCIKVLVTRRDGTGGRAGLESVRIRE